MSDSCQPTDMPVRLMTDTELQHEADAIALRMVRTDLPVRDSIVVIELANRLLRGGTQ